MAATLVSVPGLGEEDVDPGESEGVHQADEGFEVPGAPCHQGDQPRALFAAADRRSDRPPMLSLFPGSWPASGRRARVSA